jgi:hypothetical protein
MTAYAIDRNQAYRMVDALRDYRDRLNTDGLDSFAKLADRSALSIENGEHVGYGCVKIEKFDLDAAHSAVIAVMCDRRDEAQSLRDQADDLDGQAQRLEGLLTAFEI